MDNDFSANLNRMDKLANRISALSPSKRALLEQRLKQKEVKTDSQEGIGIKKRVNSNSAPLSSAQTRMWLLNQLEPDNPAYNRPSNIQLTGTVNIVALEKSLNKIVRRHEVLRTSFRASGEKLFQEIAPTYTLTLPIVNLSHLSSEERKNEVQRLATEEAQHPFDLSRLPLMRATLLILGEEEHILLLTLHHIIFDGWSMGVLLRELATFYDALCYGKPSPLPELPIQYADFANWQQQRLQGELLESQLDYWKEQLSGDLPVLELPTDRPRVALQTNRGARQYILLPKYLSESLKDLSRTQGVTLFMTLLAAFQILLYRYTGQKDIIVGSPIAGRDRLETENLIGVFINTLVLRTQLDGDPSFKELLSRVKEVATGAMVHQEIPFERLVEELQPERDLSHTPLFQVLFQLRNLAQEAVELKGLKFQEIQFDLGIAAFDLTVDIVEKPEGLSCVLAYNIDLFDADTITRMAGHFQNLLDGIVANPLEPISQLPLLTESELYQILVSWNNTSADYPSDLSIHELFETQVKRTPDAVAVVFEDKQLTYRELNGSANQLAHYLSSLGVKPEVLVGICLDRSVEMLVGLLGILKAGGAYVPIDPAYPLERNSFILSDAQVLVLLTSEKLATELPMHGLSVVCLDRDWELISAQREKNPSSGAVSSNLAYVIYTSGSTGQPKGVMIAHRSVLNLATGLNQAIYTEKDNHKRTVSLNGSIAFDTSVKQIIQLLGGHTLKIVPQELRFDGSALLSYLARNEIDVLDCTPSQLRILIEAGLLSNSAITPEYVLVGGEPIDEFTWKKLVKAKKISFYNLYGPTECTVDATVSYLKPAQEKPVIGRAITNTYIYILDRNLQPVPIGVPGELHIGGDCLARGYLNSRELTQEKFIPNPFRNLGSELKNTKLLYKTGDWARYLPDGNIEFLGRLDNQVKIRGFRIDLAEIEAVLLKHQNVKEAVVITTEDQPGQLRLVAYIVSQIEPLTTKKLRTFLYTKLPDYMIPSVFVTVESIPLTPNGKVNRLALPVPNFAQLLDSETFVAPSTPTEQQLSEIIAEVLSLERVGIHDNFFELGGHSLLGTQVISRIRQRLKVELPLRSLFKTPTVKQLSEEIAQQIINSDSLTHPILQRDRSFPSSASFTQQRWWFFNQLDPDNSVYNRPKLFRLEKSLSLEVVRKALEAIVARHEVLRTNLLMEDGELLQVIAENWSLEVPLIDLRDTPKDAREKRLKDLINQETQRPFNLAGDLMLRTTLFHLGEQEHILLLVLHHIVSDHWSSDIWFQELNMLCKSLVVGQPAPLPKLPIQYADFSLWQRQQLQDKDGQKQLDYWKQQLRGELKILNLPTDKPRPAIQTYRGSRQSLFLSPSLTAELKALSRREKVTLFMTFLAAFKVLLYRYTGEEDILVGSPVAGRPRVEAEKLLGCFLNTIVLRTSLLNNPSFQELLQRVRLVSLGAYENQDLPFEKLVDEIQPQRDFSQSPLFKVFFDFINTPQTSLETNDLLVSPLKIDEEIALFDLTLYLEEEAEGFKVVFEYNVDLFEPDTITRMMGHYQTLLEGIVAAPEHCISQLPLLTTSEQHKLLVEWNATQTEYPRDKSIHQLFEEQVERTPDAVAVVFNDKQLTYGELNGRANQLAHFLRSFGVGPEVLVGICIERSVEMVVGLLGILKAGGAYVPLDPAYPIERLAFMIEETHLKALLTQPSLIDNFPSHRTRVVCQERDSEAIKLENKTNLSNSVTSDNLAYIMYTSGSTGTPKGVNVIHRGVVRLVKETNYVNLSAEEVFLQLAPISFDASTFEIWGCLLNGARLIIFPGQAPTPEELGVTINKHQVTTLWLTSALFHLMVDERIEDLKPLRQLLAGGDVLSVSHVQKVLYKLDCQLINGYGPTENTTFTCCYPIKKDWQQRTTVPIGKPIANTQVYVLDKHLNPVPIGVEGELYIGGDGLARGYFKRPELTQENYIPNLFEKSKVKNQPSKLYKTGDLARYLPDGNIEFLGRIDHQVKVRGFRVELGEIETILNNHGQIKQAVVVAREDIPGNKRLVAYILKSNEPLKNRQLREYIKSKLPDYMVPAAFVILDILPLTPNGKVDRQALPEPDGEITREQEYVAPCTEIEKTLTNVWQELLLKEKVSTHDNFFEIGGDSILSIQVVSRAKNSGIQITAKQIFQNQTIAELASVANTTASVSAQQGIVTGVAPLTPIQRWFLAQNRQEAHHYNQSFLLQIGQDVKPEFLEKAVAKLLEHHDALRLRFTSVASEYKQINQGLDETVPFTVVDLSSTPRVKQPQALAKFASEYQASLNLSSGPIMKVALFKSGAESDARLLIIIHHLAVDGVSWRILISDLETIYQQLIAQQPIQLSAKTTAFVDWAEKLKQIGQSETFQQELDYWLNQSWSKTTPIPLDYAHTQAENTVESAARVSVKLTGEETRALLGSVNEAYNTQINDLLLSALAVTLAEWTGNSAVLIDLEGHGREELFEDVDLSRTVGWFTSMFPVLLELPRDKQPVTIIKSIKEQLRAIPNRGIGYGILRYLCNDRKVKQQLEKIPRPAISFNYLGQFDQIQSQTGWKFASESTGSNQSSRQTRDHLLNINGRVIEGQLQLNWTYSKNVHTQATMKNLAQSYVQAIRSIIKHCQSEDAFGYTPSDFPDAQLNQLELDDLLATLKTQNQNISSIYPLSPMQQGMLFHSLYAPESGVYFEQRTLEVQGNVNVTAFESAWHKVVDRHSILRTLFVWKNLPTPLQVVLKQVNLPWTNLDWKGLSTREQQQQLSELLLRQREQGFQFNQAPLIKCTLIQLSEDTYKFIWNFHHILMDGWCLPIISKEFISFYEAEVRNETCYLPAPLPYQDYIAWLNSQDKEAGIEFWRQTLQGFGANTLLVVDKLQSKNQQKDSHYQELELRLSAKVNQDLQSVAQKHHVTLSTIVQAAWALLLSRYSGEQDVVFGVTVSGRPGNLSGVEKMVGLFINSLPLRLQISPQLRLIPWIEGIQTLMVELQQYSYTPLVEIQALSEFGGGIPLFESIVVFENYPLDSYLREQGGPLQFSQRKMFEQTNYPLTVVAVPREELLLKISYDTARFESDTIERMLGHLQTIFLAIIENPQVCVGEIPLLTETEQEQLLVQWNQTNSEYPLDKYIHQLFEQQVRQTPDAVAIVFEEQQLTYGELNARANQLAHYLRSLGVGPEELVGICVERSLEMVVGLLAILKAGGAYVPLDPHYPTERLSYMLEDSGVEVLLTQQELLSSLPFHTARVVCLDSDWGAIEQHTQENLEVRVDLDNLAYAIYTSGSTGVPKGVLVAHKGLLNLVFWHQEAFAITSSDIATQLAGTAFDASVWELWPYLSAGASIHLLRTETIVQPQVLQDWLIAKKITITFIPTPLLESFLPLEWPSSTALRIVLTGGDKLHQYPSNSLPFRVFNNYGPTENTVVATSGLIVASEQTNLSPPIGRPISNTQIYILDPDLQPVPIGVPGELHIGGAGLARGYLNRPELTEEKFIPNPFNKSKLYKTGDLARYLPDGNIEFLGRIDNQVKVRGFRIELGEIEAVLNTHPQIQQAVVIATEDIPDNKRLVAYLVSEDESLSTYQLRQFLKQKLPEYMVPAAFVTLDILPLTPNGKVDRKALPVPDGEITREQEYVAPRTPSEELLISIWTEVLQVEQISIHDNFFELGGHSLLAVRLISKMSKACGSEIPVNLLFLYPTVAELATVINESLHKSTDANKSFYPLDQSVLVKIQAGRPRKIPLFFVHAVGGGVLSYTELACQLGKEQPFYGLQAPAGKSGYTPYATIETIARHYIKELLKVQPDEPYLLGGWSMGGVVSFEMAQQLKAMGKKVPLLALLDSQVPIPNQETEQEIDLIKTFATHLSKLEGKENIGIEELNQIASDEQLNYLLNQLKQAMVVSPSLSLSDFHHVFVMYKCNLRAIRRYVPSFYPGPIQLFKCVERQGNEHLNDLGWSAFAGDNLTIHEVPGNHFTMVKPPHVAYLADQLKNHLNELK